MRISPTLTSAWQRIVDGTPSTHPALAACWLLLALSLSGCTRSGFDPPADTNVPDVDSTQPDSTQRDSGPRETANDGIRTNDGDMGSDVETIAPRGPGDWVSEFSGGLHHSVDALSVGPSGEVCSTGTFIRSLTLGGQELKATTSIAFFVACFEANGALAWAKTLAGIGRPQVKAIATDNAGNIYLTGSFRGQVDFGDGVLVRASATDIFMLSYSASGAFRWAKHFAGSPASANTGQAIAVDDANRVYLTGEFADSVDFGGGALESAGGWDLFLASFDTTGRHRWSKRYGANDQERPVAIAVSSNRIAIHGFYLGDALGEPQPIIAQVGAGKLPQNNTANLFLAVYDVKDGSPIWSKGFLSVGSDKPSSVGIDSRGNIVIAGAYGPDSPIAFGGRALPEANEYNGYVASFLDDGGHVWSGIVGEDPSSGDSTVLGLVIGPKDTIFITGSSPLTTDFGSKIITPAGVEGGAFVLNYDPGGFLLRGEVFGGKTARAIDLDGGDTVVVGGDHGPPISLGGVIGSDRTTHIEGYVLRRKLTSEP